jgi:hypothetical protein
MSGLRVGRVWVWDEQHAGAFWLEDGELCHAAQFLEPGPDGALFDWEASGAVDFFSIDDYLVAPARAAERLLAAAKRLRGEG